VGQSLPPDDGAKFGCWLTGGPEAVERIRQCLES